MKKVTFLLTLLFVLGISYSANAITIRALGAGGYTAADIDVIDGHKWNYGASGQFLVDVLPLLSIGAEVGYVHALTVKSGSISQSTDYLDVDLMIELTFLDLIVVQGGGGGYFGVGDNKDHYFGVMLGFGVQIPVIPSLLSIPILARADFIFANGTTVMPFRLMAGITISL